MQQNDPDKSIRSFVTGNSTDIVAHVAAAGLGRELDQMVKVKNRGGGSLPQHVLERLNNAAAKVLARPSSSSAWQTAACWWTATRPPTTQPIKRAPELRQRLAREQHSTLSNGGNGPGRRLQPAICR